MPGSISYQASQPHGIMFHHFYDATHPKGQGAISAEQLDKLIQYVGPKRFLSAKEWVARAVENTLEKNHVCLSFDDALRCQYDVALPVLQKYGLTAFWFVYSSVFEGELAPLEIYRYYRTKFFDDIDDFYDAFNTAAEKSIYAEKIQLGMQDFEPDNYLKAFPYYSNEDRIFRYVRDDILGPEAYFNLMDAMIENERIDKHALREILWMQNTELQDLDAGEHVIGLHSYTHPTRMAVLPAKQQQREYVLNHQHLHSVLGKKPYTMSHPCNSYNQDTLDILNDLNIKVGFCANMSKPRTSLLDFPREDHINIIKEMEETA